jgi:hypothetical protein
MGILCNQGTISMRGFIVMCSSLHNPLSVCNRVLAVVLSLCSCVICLAPLGQAFMVK